MNEDYHLKNVQQEAYFRQKVNDEIEGECSSINYTSRKQNVKEND